MARFLLLTGVLAFAVATGTPAGGAVSPPQTSPAGATVVLAYPDDPYRPLARDIAARESVPLASSLEDALASQPTFLLWVVSPGRLSDRIMTEFSLALDRRPNHVAAGLITGSTLKSARDLYERRNQVTGVRTATVLGRGVFERGKIIEAPGRQPRAIDKVSDVLVLTTRSDYVHYAGHGGSGYWRPLENERLTPGGITGVPGLVVSTDSCNTGRIWEHNSIALGFVDRGAAAYSGFYYSPMSGFHIGDHAGPFRHTWPEFPIGFVIQVRDAGAAKGYAGLPFSILLGDPRTALNASAPCRFVDESDSSGARRVSCRQAPAGLVPVRVRGGARFGFIEIPDLAAVWARESFYNHRLQTTTVGDDRLILVDHEGGDLELRLRLTPPVTWLAINPLTDALDDLLVVMADRRHGGDVIALVLAAAATLVVVRRARERTSSRRVLRPAATVGLIASVLHAAYGFLRQDAVVTIGKTIVFSPLAAVGTGLLVACGMFFFLNARSWRGRLAGVVTATLVGWVGALMVLAMRMGTSALIRSKADIDAWIYTPEWHPFIMSALGCAVCAVIFSASRRMVRQI